MTVISKPGVTSIYCDICGRFLDARQVFADGVEKCRKCQRKEFEALPWYKKIFSFDR
jgi:hypothetical protein